MNRTRCPLCKGKLSPGEKIHPDCIAPWADARQAKAERAAVKKATTAAKQDRKETREKLDGMKTIAQLIADAQKPFNEFIRLRDVDKGCFVCGRPFDQNVLGREQHAGHVRSRAAAGHLRFNENNVLGECCGCNGPNGAKPHEIKAGAIARIGLEAWEALENDNTPHKWGRDELIAIKSEYLAKARNLRKKLKSALPVPFVGIH